MMLVFAAIDVVEVSAMTGFNGAGLVAYRLKLPALVGLLLPVALVIGVQLTQSSLKKSGEWVAALASGISPASWGVRLMGIPLIAAVGATPLVLDLGPRMLARFHDSIGALGPATTSGESQWVKQGRWLIRMGADDTPDLVLSRDGVGRALSRWTVPTDREREAPVATWHRGTGWRREPVSDHLRDGLSHLPHRHVTPKAAMLPGDTLPIGALSAAIRNARSLGRPARLLEAERALRVALILGCLVMPLVGVGLSLSSREQRASRLIALGLGVTATYWFLATLAWHGVALGLLSFGWLAGGVPGLFLVIAGVGHVVRTAACRRHR